MRPSLARLLARLLPVIAFMIALAVWFNDIQENGPYVLRNVVPPALTIVLSWLTLYRGQGRWTGSGWRLPLATFGFAIPACGLSSYLHYAYSVNLDNMFSEGAGQLFRFLPLYTIGAGCIGFVIGWIAGRNI